MATNNSLLLNGLSGKVGRELVFKQYGGKSVVCKYPDMSNRKFSSRQKQLQETMAEANYNARSILRDEKLRMKAQIRLNVTSNKLYTALIKEYFTNVWPTVKTPAEKNAKARK